MRESPILVTFDGKDPANQKFVGHHLTNKFVKENVEMLEKEMGRLIEDSNTKGKDLDELKHQRKILKMFQRHLTAK